MFTVRVRLIAVVINLRGVRMWRVDLAVMRWLEDTRSVVVVVPTNRLNRPVFRVVELLCRCVYELILNSIPSLSTYLFFHNRKTIVCDLTARMYIM